MKKLPLLLAAFFLLASPVLAQSVRHVLIFTGQSNMGGTGGAITAPDGAQQMGPVRQYLPTVPSWSAVWAGFGPGAPLSSVDGNIYQKPVSADGDVLYLTANGGGPAYVYDSFGPWVGAKASTSGTWVDENNFGPELTFCKKWQADHPGAKLAVIKVTLGGSSIDQYLPPTGSEWLATVKAIDFLKARAAASGETLLWDGIVQWHGENGWSSVWPYLNPTAGQEYSDKDAAFLTALRGITDPVAPISLARIGDWMLHSDVIGTTVNGIDTPENRIAAANYRRAQQDKLATMLPRLAVVNMDGLTRLRQGSYSYHLEGRSYLTAGERLYAGWLIAQGLTPPPPPPPLDVQIWQGGVLSSSLTADVFLNGVLQGKAGDIIRVEIRNK